MSSYWFIPLIIESILLLICIAYESGVSATLSLIVAGFVIHLAGFVNVRDFVTNNISGILWGSLCYVIAGIIWSFVKWILFVFKKKEAYDKRWADFQILHKHEGEAKIKELWKQIIVSSQRSAPQVGDYKDRIALWFFYWPFSMINTVVQDFTKKLFNLVYNTVKNSFQRVSDRIFANNDTD